MILSSAQGANHTTTQKPTAIVPMLALNAEEPIILLHVKKQEKQQQPVLYVEVITPQIIKVAEYTKTCKRKIDQTAIHQCRTEITPHQYIKMQPTPKL